MSVRGDWGQSSRYTFERGDSFRDRQRSQHPPDPDTEATGLCTRGKDGEWCASRKTVTLPDGTSAVVPATTPRAFCALDEDIIRRCLHDPAGDGNDIAGAWGRLHEALGEQVTTEVMVHIDFGPAEPINLGADALMRFIAVSLRTWHGRMAAVGRGGSFTAPDPELDYLSQEAVSASSRALATHLSVLLALAPAEMSRSFPMKPVKPRDARLQSGGKRLVQADLEEARGGEEIMHLGEDFVTLWTADPAHTTGSAAGNEILHLEWAARSLLRETPARPVELDGVPCRAERCDSKRALRRAEPPQHEGDPEYWSVCADCRDLMTWDEYREWVDINAAWLRGRLTPAQIAAGMAGREVA